MNQFQVLVINPGSTSTKIGLFLNGEKMFQKVIRHSSEELASYSNILEQAEFRKNLVLATAKEVGINLKALAAVAGRGGLLAPVTGGTYRVNEKMRKELQEGKRGAHASNLGALIAHEIAEELGIPSFIVDPVCVDEMHELARLSGLSGIRRESFFHALNQKAIARRVAADLKKPYEDLRLIVVHLGGGITIGVHVGGSVIDVNNAIAGEGPYSPERSGGVPIGGLVKMCFSGQYTEEEILKTLVGRGGLVSYLGTNDAQEVERRIERGDEKARLVYEGMAYQVSKEIGAAATVLKGNVDTIAITGGLANSGLLVNWIVERVNFIAPVRVYPGEDELEALAAGVLRVLTGEEEAKEYVDS